MATVWAFQKLEELDGRTGFVQCDDALAAKLIDQKLVQDPRVGGGALKVISDKPLVKKVVKKRKKKVIEEKDIETTDNVDSDED